MTEVPKPGTKEARERGCKCPVIDNYHGLGRGGDGAKWGWIVNDGCPLHDPKRSCRECRTD